MALMMKASSTTSTLGLRRLRSQRVSFTHTTGSKQMAGAACTMTRRHNMTADGDKELGRGLVSW